MNSIIAAVFPDRMSAERAVNNLRNLGVSDSAISVITMHDQHLEGHDHTHDKDHGAHADNTATGALKGVGIGAGVGALFGLAAAFIPGIGPFITAGALASTLGAVGGAAAAGAIVGGATGGIVGLLENYGLSGEDARHYADAIGRGGVFVGVASGQIMNDAEIRRVLQEAGGKTSAYMA